MVGSEALTGSAFLDLAFLDQYTGGDMALRNQVLDMFIDQVKLLLDQLDGAVGSPGDWRQITHSLKGCARGVGANAVADTARRAEAAAHDSQEVHLQLIDELRADVEPTLSLIREAINSQ